MLLLLCVFFLASGLELINKLVPVNHTANSSYYKGSLFDVQVNVSTSKPKICRNMQPLIDINGVGNLTVFFFTSPDESCVTEGIQSKAANISVGIEAISGGGFGYNPSGYIKVIKKY